MLRSYIVCILIAIILLFSGCNKAKYSADARDIWDHWGKDNQYQLTKNDFFSLTNEENEAIIDPVIYGYFKSKPFVYFVGLKGYTILNYETGEIKQNKELKSFSEKEVKVFNNNKFKLLSKTEYIEINIDSFVNKNKYKFNYVNLRLGYNYTDENTKQYLLKNKDNILKQEILKWFDNYFDSAKGSEVVEKELLEFLNKEFVQGKIIRVAMDFSYGY